MLAKARKPAAPKRKPAKPAGTARKPGKTANPVAVAQPRPRGRQSTYDSYIAEEILRRLADGEALITICKDDGMPAESTVRWWVVNDTQGFAARYAQARDVGLDHRAERLPMMAAAAVGMDGPGVQAVRLAVETEKWIVSKLAPKRYGERLDLNVDGNLNVGQADTQALLGELRDLLTPMTSAAKNGGGNEPDA